MSRELNPLVMKEIERMNLKLADAEYKIEQLKNKCFVQKKIIEEWKSISIQKGIDIDKLKVRIKELKTTLLNEREENNLFNSAYPSIEVMKRLISSSEILLYKKDYDGHNYEEIEQAIKEAKLYLTQNQSDGS